MWSAPVHSLLYPVLYVPGRARANNENINLGDFLGCHVVDVVVVKRGIRGNRGNRREESKNWGGTAGRGMVE